MSDLLEPGEVDALLAAVKSGDVTLAGGPGAGAADAVTPYDFKRPERVTKDQLRAIAVLHERFARSLSAMLTGLMRTAVEVSVSNVRQLNYSEFIAGLPNPTTLAVISASALPGRLLLESGREIAFLLIDRMLGGAQKQVPVPDRALTEIEQRLFKRLVGQSLPLLEETWSNLLKTTFSVGEISTNPQLVQIVAPHETIVLVTFDITLDANSGSMGLVLPCSAIEPVMAQLATQNWFAAGPRVFDETQAVRMTRALSGAALDMVADLAETSITVRELMDLQVGDVIKTDLPVDGEITLCVEGHAKFKGQPGRVRRNKAVHITRRMPPEA